MITPPSNERVIIHKVDMPKISRNAIRAAITNEDIPATNVALSVAKGINIAMKNNTNRGATTKFTTFCITSNRLPGMYDRE